MYTSFTTQRNKMKKAQYTIKFTCRKLVQSHHHRNTQYTGNA